MSEEKTEKDPTNELMAALEAYPNAPVAETVESWKQQYGEVMCSGFSNTELVIWRALTRKEYVALQKVLRTPTQDPANAPTEYDFEESVVKTCILWSSMPNLDTKGGTISTLSEQIMLHSNFMNQQLAAALVLRL